MEDKDKIAVGKKIGGAIGWLCRTTSTVFIVLRACDVIDWAWWQVLMPTFIGLGVAALSTLVLGAITVTVLANEEESK